MTNSEKYNSFRSRFETPDDYWDDDEEEEEENEEEV